MTISVNKKVNLSLRRKHLVKCAIKDYHEIIYDKGVNINGKETNIYIPTTALIDVLLRHLTLLQSDSINDVKTQKILEKMSDTFRLHSHIRSHIRNQIITYIDCMNDIDDIGIIENLIQFHEV